MDDGWPAAAASHWDSARLRFPSATSKDGCDVLQVEECRVEEGLAAAGSRALQSSQCLSCDR